MANQKRELKNAKHREKYHRNRPEPPCASCRQREEELQLDLNAAHDREKDLLEKLESAVESLTWCESLLQDEKKKSFELKDETGT